MRLIDADALIKDFKRKCQGNCKKCYNSTFLASDEHCGLIDEAPTVEAKPVVKGEWKSDLDSCGWINHTCSHCGYEKLTDIHVSLDWNFCPNCGADMRGEKHD